MSDAVAAIYCISLFNFYVTVTVLGEVIYCIGKPFGGPSLSFWPGCHIFISNEHVFKIKYSGTVKFLYM